MRRRSRLSRLAAALLAVSAAASAEVVDVGDNGFAVRDSATVAADADRAWAALVDVGKWWDPAHTYSGDGANLSLDPKPQGCWCERVGGRPAVVHMTVLFAQPGKLLRLTGGLGPLQSMAVTGTMTWTLTPAGNGTSVELSYAVGGYNRGGFKDLAPGVDAVLRAQFDRYVRFVNTGRP
jgi:Polyketide cyclase / dehydrase and lipid transport